jgi:molybdopterin converting factor small subunit
MTMIKINLEFISWLTEALEAEGVPNSRHLEVGIEEESTVKDLLFRMAAKYPRFGQSIFNTALEKLNENICIFRNDRLLELDQGLLTALKNGDKIVFVPVFPGG